METTRPIGVVSASEPELEALNALFEAGATGIHIFDHTHDVPRVLPPFVVTLSNGAGEVIGRVEGDNLRDTLDETLRQFRALPIPRA